MVRLWLAVALAASLALAGAASAQVPLASTSSADAPLPVCEPTALAPYLCSPAEIALVEEKKRGSDCNFASVSQGCAPGFFGRPALSSTTYECCAGYYCPALVSCTIPCSPGGFCPHATTLIASGENDTCMPYTVDPVFMDGARVQASRAVPAGDVWLCGGAATDFPCASGSYCPAADTEIPCPAGHFCRAGTTAPHKCPILCFCPARTKRPRLGFLFVIVGLGSIAIGIALLRVYYRIRDWRREIRDRAHKLAAEQLPAIPSINPDFGTSSSVSDANSDFDGYWRESDTPRESLLGLSQRSALETRQYTLHLCYTDVSVQLEGSEKVVLRGVSGRFFPGRLTAIMGGSGAGKTTLLNALTGRSKAYAKRSGAVTINGVPVSDLHLYSGDVGFVPQDDVMLTELTVMELFRFNAHMRLPKTYGPQKIRNTSRAVLDLMGLMPHRHQVVGDVEKRGLSGGQRKRVNIGMELVSDPLALFLDEPTSGLDSSSSQDIGRCLQEIAAAGVLVVAVIHQPRYEVFKLFDDVVILAQGGRVAYHGPTAFALDYFSRLGFTCPNRTNPADFILDVVSGSPPEGSFSPTEDFNPPLSALTEALADRWDEFGRDFVTEATKDAYADVAERFPEETAPYQPRDQLGALKQCIVFTYRALVQQTRGTAVLLDCALVLVACVTLGILYSNNTLIQVPQSNYIMSLCMGLIGIQSSLRHFGGERIVYFREANAGLSKLSYFMGKNIAHIPWILFAPFLFTALFYFIAAPRAPFEKTYVVLLTIQWSCSGLGYITSLLFRPHVAQLAGVVFGLLANMFAGFVMTMQQMDNISKLCRVFYQISYARWALESLWINEAKEFSPVFDDQVEQKYEFFQYKEDNFMLDQLALLALGFAFRAVALFLMLVKERKKQT